MAKIDELNKLVKNILINDKKRNSNIQDFLKLFVDSYNSDLNFNATPLSDLIKGLKKTDASLVKQWFAEVTNAKLYLNVKKNYVVKYNNAEDKTLVTNEQYTTLNWYDLAKKAEVTFKDYYKDLEEAKKRIDATLEKALNTAKNPEERAEIIAYITNQFKD